MNDITRAAIEYISRYKEQDEELHKIAPKNSISYYATGKCLEYWDMAIEALENQKSVIEELEKIKTEINGKDRQWLPKGYLFELIDNHISELKGENNE